MRGSITTTGSAQVRGNQLVASLRFAYKTDPETLYAEVHFAVEYSLTGPITPDDARAFSKVNALFNTWPYMREAVQNIALRMAMPVPQVPLLKIR